MVRPTVQALAAGRQSLEPFAEGAVPQDPGKDLAILVELAALEKELTPLAPTLRGFGVWAGLRTDVAKVELLLNWSLKTREVIDTLGSLTTGGEARKQQMFRLMTERLHLLDQGGSARTAFNALREAWTTAQASQERIGQLAGRPKPNRPLSSGPDWIERSINTLGRWRADLHQAQAWCNWNAVKARGMEAGLDPLVDALEEGGLESRGTR